ncbi:hypothetical protein HOO31_04765 [Aliarcobacter cryaerophilus]|uniref:hypothetical protein n=1 Tax=Aliarcobacter cryaerophilus TaxID=28198 RepID=UPI00164BADA0|nr:hypothetical protein [Aliarcobacter cryaerophilus]QNK85922.1 hypothetical protein HOO31_04765 [Aliarcobacter cryaerophilus]
MREKKLYEIELDTKEEADELKKELNTFSITDTDDGNTYNGITTFDYVEIRKEFTVTLSTYLELEEFKDILYDNTKNPVVFRYGIKKIKMR